MIVTKFGGTSLANPVQIEKVRKIINKDPERKVVVVSAPGKDDYIPYKVTDLLLRLAGEINEQNKNLSKDDSLALIKKRFSMICQYFGLSELEQKILSEIGSLEGKPWDFIASRGESFNAEIMARVLGIGLYDAQGKIKMRQFNGKIEPDLSATEVSLRGITDNSFVFPGFYGSLNGQLVVFKRGGSDLTGSILAYALDAKLYENWTDVDGIFYASDKIVPRERLRVVPSMTYRELRELTYMGTDAFQDQAVYPVAKKRIPVRIKNTNNPSGEGTLISSDPRTSEIPIAGIAARPGFISLEVGKFGMNEEIGFGARLLQIFSGLNIGYEHAPSGIDNMAVILQDSDYFRRKRDELIQRIHFELKPDSLEQFDSLALIAVVGEGMRNTPGIMKRISGAISERGINIEIINQAPSETNVILGVKEKDYKKAVREIYKEFVEKSKGEI